MKTLFNTIIAVLVSSFILISCSSDNTTDPTDNGSNSDAPLSCTITGEFDLLFEAASVYYSNVPGDEEVIRTLQANMDHEGKSHILSIVLTDPDGQFKKNYELGLDYPEAVCVFMFDQGTGLPPVSYSINSSGSINFTTLTDTKAVGTFNFVASNVEGTKQITVTNGVINKK